MKLRLKNLGFQEYQPVLEAMRQFTDSRDVNTTDELWLTEHPPVYTLGRNGDRAHILAPGSIPIVDTDRGGQVTYHGPGQLIAYTLFDLRRQQIGPRGLVNRLENTVIATLGQYGILSQARGDAPGVYVSDRKIASLGLRIRRGCSYHGLSFNISVALEPFRGINPCGYQGLEVTRLCDLGIAVTVGEAAVSLVARLMHEFGYHQIES